MFALVDCDHFFASCERVFRPDLWRSPVVVLSNNDGCVIARSPEVKAIGIKMGEPLFQCESTLRAHGVAVFSSNFSLYADLSRRVIETIRGFIESSGRPRVEVYSIDEAFIDLSDLAVVDLESLAHELRFEIYRRSGIPVSIGIGSSKSLAKVATYYAKRSSERVRLIRDDRDRLYALRNLPIDELWGVGRQWAERLRRIGIERASDLALATPERIRLAARHIYLLRLSRELRGERCIPLETSPPPRLSVRYSRTFARAISDDRAIRDAVCAFAAQLGRRLRSHNRRAGSLSLSLSALDPSSRSSSSYAQRRYHISVSGGLPTYTHDSPSLIKRALELYQSLSERAEREAPRSLGRPIRWRKAGLLALDLRDESQLELSIVRPDERRLALSTLEDELNRRFGRGIACIGSLPIKPHTSAHQNRQSSSLSDRGWRPIQSALSPRYTTSWADLPVVSAL